MSLQTRDPRLCYGSLTKHAREKYHDGDLPSAPNCESESSVPVQRKCGGWGVQMQVQVQARRLIMRLTS